MKRRLLIMAVALGSMFGAHQAVAKSSKPDTANKKHHKKQKKTKSTSSAAPTMVNIGPAAA